MDTLITSENLFTFEISYTDLLAHAEEAMNLLLSDKGSLVTGANLEFEISYQKNRNE